MSTNRLFHPPGTGLPCHPVADAKKIKGDPNLAKRIATAIDDYSGMNQRQVAEAMGVTPQTVTKWRR